MRLYHRTNYWGKIIFPSDRDPEISFSVIWLQALQDHEEGHGCCFGHGRRSIEVTNDHFSVSDEWSVHFISGAQGQRNDSQYFFKFVLIPKNDPECKDKSLVEESSWIKIGQISSDNAIDNLDLLLKSYFDGRHGMKGCRYHVHVALKIHQLVP